MNKTKSNKKKFCRQVITPQKRELDRARNSRPVWPCEPLCALFPGAAGTDTGQGCEGGFGPVSEELARMKVEAAGYGFVNR